MQLAVVDFINSCPICNAIKPLRTSKPFSGALSKPNLFDMVSMDFIGLHTIGGRKFHILCMVDHYSRYMVTCVLDRTASPAARTCLRDHWVSKFGAPLAILTDKGPEFTSDNFKSYVKDVLKCELFYSSTEYPQGNGINESSHRILETAIKTSAPRLDFLAEDIVADATLLYNVTPNRKIGDTPSSLAFGIDVHVPGLIDFEPEMSEEARLMHLRNYRGLALLTKQLNEIESTSLPEESTLPMTFKVGDIVTYRLSTSEKVKHIHFSEESKYTATRSFPQRVVKVSENNLVMTPLWTKGKERSAPEDLV